MSCLFKWLLNLYQFYTILFGFSYAYVNIEKHMVKFNILVKIYVTFINIIYTIIMIYFLIINCGDTLRHLTGVTAILECTFITYTFIRLCLIIGLLVFRLKEEKIFKEIYLSQINYIEQCLCNTTTRNDKTTERIQFLYISILFIHGFFTIYRIISEVINGEWQHLIIEVSFNIFLALEHNIMFHHCLILSYIINLYAKLNNQLEREEVSHTLSDIYLKLSFLLQNVNTTIGPLIFGVLLSELLTIAFYIRTLYLLINMMQIYIERGLEITILLLCVSFNIFLYFWMCDRFNSTIYKTGEIIKEYIAKNQNFEVCMFYFLVN